jgi:hypothetical protein
MEKDTTMTAKEFYISRLKERGFTDKQIIQLTKKKISAFQKNTQASK